MEIKSCEYSQLNAPQDIKSVQKIRILSWLPSSIDLEVQILMNWPKTL
jgi:hypothetical protein